MYYTVRNLRHVCLKGIQNVLLNSTLNVLKQVLRLRANAQKNRAKSANRGHSSKPNLPSFSVCNKVLMSL